MPPPKNDRQGGRHSGGHGPLDLQPASLYVGRNDVVSIGPGGEGAIVAAPGTERDVHVDPEGRRITHYLHHRAGTGLAALRGSDQPRAQGGEEDASSHGGRFGSQMPVPSRIDMVAARSSDGLHPPSGPTSTVGYASCGGTPPGAAIATPGSAASEAAVTTPVSSGIHTRRLYITAWRTMCRSRVRW